jgi:glycosyltransferase involved in cell wall biosynthesis
VKNDAPRVIHIVDSLDNTAVEKWLVRMLRHAVENKLPVDWTFYCTIGKGLSDQDAEALGAKVVHSPVPIGSKWAFVQTLRSELRRGAYQVLHSHHDVVSAVYFLAAWGLPIEKRIVHVHNADESVLTPSVLKRAVFPRLFRNICLLSANQIIGNSNHSLDTFLAGRKRREGRDVVHYYGINPEPFVKATGDCLAFRRKLGLADDARILLFAGRVVPEKNPVFAVDVIAEMRRLNSRVVGVFAGAGSLENDVRQRAAELGVEPWVRYLGWRNDMAEIMSGCDWFILPHPEHPMEGFGIAVVEAQLAGLRLLLSRGIADDPLLPTASMRRLSLSQDAKEWAAAAMDLWSIPTSRQAAFAAFQQSPMAMDRALRELVELHTFTPHPRRRPGPPW